MKVFCSVSELRANGAGLNFKSKLRPAMLARFTRRDNFKNFKECEEEVNLPLEARIVNRAVGAISSGFEAYSKMADREAVSARRVSSTCRGAKTASAMPIDTAASKNISNFAPLKHCADRKNFKIFASGKIKFTTHGELKFTMRGMVKFTARRRLKFEPCDIATRDFALCDRILNPKPRKSRASFKISSRRGEKTK